MPILGTTPLGTAPVGAAAPALGAPPTATITAPSVSGGLPGATVNYAGTAKRFDGTDLPASAMKWYVDTGATAGVYSLVGNGVASGSIVLPWRAAGAYTVKLVVDDGANGSDVKTVSYLADTAPTATTPSVSGSLYAGVALSFGSTAADSDSGDTASLAWTSSDGGSQTGGATFTHTFAAAGTYTVTATPVDSLGQSGNPASRSVTIAASADGMTFGLVQCTRAGQPIPDVVVQLTLGGVPYAQPNVSVTLTAPTFTGAAGALSGTTTVTTDANGKATFSGLAISASGGYTVTATVTTPALSKTKKIVIRGAAYSFNGAYATGTATGTAGADASWYWEDPVSGSRTRYALWSPPTAQVFPSGVKVARPILGWSPPSGFHYNAAKAPYEIATNTYLSTVLSSNPATYPWYALYLQQDGANSEGDKWSARRAFGFIVRQLEADGWLFDKTRYMYAGYSTGGIQAFRFAYEFPNFCSTIICIDGAPVLGDMFNVSGQVTKPRSVTITPGPYATITDASLWDYTESIDGSLGGPDVAGEWARVVSAGGTNFLGFTGTDVSEFTSGGIEVLQHDGTGTTSFSPAKKRNFNNFRVWFNKLIARGQTAPRVAVSASPNYVVPDLTGTKHIELLFDNGGAGVWDNGLPVTSVPSSTGRTHAQMADAPWKDGTGAVQTNVMTFLANAARSSAGLLPGEASALAFRRRANAGRTGSRTVAA